MASVCGLAFCVLRVIYVLAVVTNCPPETGGTSAKRGGGGLKGERRNENFAIKREQRQVRLDSAEREQSQDRKAGLNEK